MPVESEASICQLAIIDGQASSMKQEAQSLRGVAHGTLFFDVPFILRVLNMYCFCTSFVAVEIIGLRAQRISG